MTEQSNIIFLLNDHQTFYGHEGRKSAPEIKRPHFKNLAKKGVNFT